MWMTLFQRSSGNLNKLRCFLQCRNILCSTVTHTGPDTTDQLEYGVLHSSFVCHTSFYTFWNKLLSICLEIAVFTTILHCCNRSHSTINFIFTSLEQLECSRAFVTSCKDTSHHADTRSGCQGLCHISGILDTAICNDRHIILFSCLISIHDRCHLWYTNTCYNTCCTNRSRSYSNLNTVSTGFDQSFCSLSRCHITGNDLKIRISFTDHLDTTKHVCTMSMCRIQHDTVNMLFYQSSYTI